MAFAVVANTATSAATTGAINTTGADLLVVMLGDASGSNPNGSISDSKGNVWTIVSYAGQGIQQCIMYVSYPTSVGSGHTFSTAGTNAPAMAVIAFSGSAGQYGKATTGGATTVQPGSIALAQSVGLLVTAVTFGVIGATMSINGGFTISDQVTTSGAHVGVAMAYLITATGTNTPTWTVSSSSGMSSVMAAFNNSGGGGGGSAGGSYGFA